MSGVILLLLTLAMAFTGQVLRFDQDAYWGLGIGASVTGRIPLIGGQLVHLLLAGPIIGGETLSRFFSFHVFIIPGLILALVSIHLRLVLTRGINEYPRPGHPVVKATYDNEYKEILKKDGVPFAPDAIGKDLVFAAVVIAGILLCALVFGPKGPSGPPNPTIIETNPRPDFYFLAIFAALALLPVWMEVVALFFAPAAVVIYLLALPFIANTGEKSWKRRPVAVLSVIFIVTVICVLAWEGENSPWSPKMEAWSSDPIPPPLLRSRTPLELRGALVFQNKQCRDCHSLGNVGGKRGPALDDVASRMTRPELIRQVIQGGGNMPAYGKKLSPPEVDALASFLQTLGSARTGFAHNSAPPPRREGE
jgi:ubiquinol-cytochrome c reductase cytochrome b subunit